MKSRRIPRDLDSRKVMGDVCEDELTPFIRRLEEITERYFNEVLELSHDAASATGLDRKYGFMGPLGYADHDFNVPAIICLEPMMVSFRAYRRAKHMHLVSDKDEEYQVRRKRDLLAAPA